MSEHTPPGKTGFPNAHAGCALVCFLGAVLTLGDLPRPAPQHSAIWVPALLIWGVASLYQFLLAAGHLRTAILDRQHLFSSSRYERSSDLGWMLASVVVLIVVGLFYARREDSIPLLAGQTVTLVCLLVTSILSLAVWALRRAMTPKTSPSQETAP